MARKPRDRKEKREPAHKMDGDGMELTGGDGAQGTTAVVESECIVYSVVCSGLLGAASGISPLQPSLV